VMGFNLSGVPTAASIIDAKLMLTVAGNSGWDNLNRFTTNSSGTEGSLASVEDILRNFTYRWSFVFSASRSIKTGQPIEVNHLSIGVKARNIILSSPPNTPVEITDSDGNVIVKDVQKWHDEEFKKRWFGEDFVPGWGWDSPILRWYNYQDGVEHLFTNPLLYNPTAIPQTQETEVPLSTGNNDYGVQIYEMPALPTESDFVYGELPFIDQIPGQGQVTGKYKRTRDGKLWVVVDPDGYYYWDSKERLWIPVQEGDGLDFPQFFTPGEVREVFPDSEVFNDFPYDPGRDPQTYQEFFEWLRGVWYSSPTEIQYPFDDLRNRFPAGFRSTRLEDTLDITTRIWVTYNFDGAIAPAIPGFRAMSWGADKINFTWLKFVNGLPPFADSYNPHEGRDHPWSVKAWYKWGARQFHLHMPFGRPFVQISPPTGFENYEHLAYQADQYLCAAEGFSDNQVTYNAPMFHLVQDFERIWRSLIEGKQYCTDAEWASLTEWFNPNDPIRVIAYNGAITKGGQVEENQYPRWSRLFNENYDAALGRLKSSVQPFINCGMQISIDALAGAPGPVPGLYISTDQLSAKAQAGWWEFYMWLVGKVGTQNLYCESAPEKRRNLVTGKLDQSPYLGLNVMASEDWSYFPASTAISFHKLSELGPVKYLRCPYWGGGGPKAGRVNRYLSPARYPDLIQYSDTNGEYENSKGDGEYRINRQRIDLFLGSAFEEIYVARNLRDRFDQEGDPRPEMNRTIPGYMISPMCLQEYPISWAAPGLKRFIDKFRSIQALGEYVNAYEPTASASLT